MNAVPKFGNLDRLDAMAQTLLPHGTAVKMLDLRGTVPKPLPGEAIAVQHAVTKRQQEFAGGRAAARTAMMALGLTPGEILPQADRSPKWPSGMVGSISHCNTACVSVVARATDMTAIGIDIEEATPLDEALLSLICTPKEINWLNTQDAHKRLLLAKLIFSAKEAAYKCQYPLSRELFGFEGFDLDIDTEAQGFCATFQRDAFPFVFADTLSGRYVIENGYVLSAVWIKACNASLEKTAQDP